MLAVAAISLLGLSGSFLATIFWRGRRRLSAGLAFIFLCMFAFSASQFSEDQAVKEGFASFSDKMDAKKAGYTDAAAWSAFREIGDAERAEMAAEAAEKAKAEAEAEEAKQLALIAEEKARAEAEAVRQQAEDAKAQELGHHCLSLWDGSHPAFIEAITAQLRDPNSFEHAKTVTMPVDSDGTNNIAMEFRAKNGFGGMNVGMAVGSFDNLTCKVTVAQLIED